MVRTKLFSHLSGFEWNVEVLGIYWFSNISSKHKLGVYLRGGTTTPMGGIFSNDQNVVGHELLNSWARPKHVTVARWCHRLESSR